MGDLTREERNLAIKAFNRGMLWPGFAIAFVGIALNLFARASIAIPILAIALIAIGMTIGLIMGFRNRRATIDEILAKRQAPSTPPAPRENP
jgi:ABC-type dipeptide/oligopeptide/nickel transport system permease subunit